jgi:hypothetical protein
METHTHTHLPRAHRFLPTLLRFLHILGPLELGINETDRRRASPLYIPRILRCVPLLIAVVGKLTREGIVQRVGVLLRGACDRIPRGF